MFEQQSHVQIKADILQALRTDGLCSTSPGSFADLMAGPVAFAIGEVYRSFPALVSMLFLDESSGPFMDVQGEQYFNMKRKEGARASGTITLYGDSGAQIPARAQFLSAEGLCFYLRDACTIGADGSAQAAIDAAEPGAQYNLAAGALLRMYVSLQGIASFESSETSGGVDTESDRAYLSRIEARRKRPPTSGNGFDYQSWALEIAGVGYAKVTELAFGAGTVKLCLLDSSRAPATQTLLESVRLHIEDKRPVGAGVTVKTATPTPIVFAATVQLRADALVETVSTAFTAALAGYFADVIAEKYNAVYREAARDLPYQLYYNRVAALLIGIDGVQNFTSLTLNGASRDLRIEADAIPSVERVVITL